jgi:hypothetical protein
MILVTDLVPGMLSCKFHGGYHGDDVVLFSYFGKVTGNSSKREI